MSTIPFNDAIEDIKKDGFVKNITGLFKLPDDLTPYLEKEQRVYSSNAKLIDAFWELNDKEALTQTFHELAEKIHGGPLEPQEPYVISRVVSSTSLNESFRSHFDSHVLTVVIPIQVPDGEKYKQGELVVMPKKRHYPKSEIINIIQKIFYGSFIYRWWLMRNTKKLEEQDKIKVVHIGEIDNLVFKGTETLHCNFPFEGNSIRQTLLLHYGDPKPNGIGSFFRKLRNR